MTALIIIAVVVVVAIGFVWLSPGVNARDAAHFRQVADLRAEIDELNRKLQSLTPSRDSLGRFVRGKGK